MVNHVAHAVGGFHLALRKQGELAHLGAHKEHCRCVFAGGDAGSATDAGGGVKGSVGVVLFDGYRVGVGQVAHGIHRNESAGLNNSVKGTAVHHQVAHHREGLGPPWLNRNSVAVFELAHMKLAGSHPAVWTVGLAVDEHGAHSANSFAAVVVKNYGLGALRNELLVEHVHHF